MSYQETDHINNTDYVMILQDGCIKIILLEDFIKNITLGGFSICQSWLNCICGIGQFTTYDLPQDTPPQMEDLNITVQNRGIKVFASDDFLSKYYDAENDVFGKIIIQGGDPSGYTLNGNPIYIGMMIPANELGNLKYESKNQGAAYTQDLFFEAYDINNVKAESI